MTKNEEKSGGEQIGVDVEVGCKSGSAIGAAQDETALVCRIDGKTLPSFTDDTMIGDSGTSCHLLKSDEGMERGCRSNRRNGGRNRPPPYHQQIS